MALYHLPDMKYHPEYCDKMIELMAKGYYKTKLAAHFKVATKTLNEWLEKYPEFKTAYDIGYPLSMDWWMTKGQEKYLENDNDKGFKYWQFMMKIIFGLDANSTTATTNNITIGSMNVLNTKSESELLEILEQKTAKINPYKVIDVTPIKDDN